MFCKNCAFEKSFMIKKSNITKDHKCIYGITNVNFFSAKILSEAIKEGWFFNFTKFFGGFFVKNKININNQSKE